MGKNILFILLCIILTSSTIIHRAENPTVKKAIELQQTVINDPLFEKILKELEAAGQIDWSRERTKYIREKFSDYASNIDWLLSKYKSRGGFGKDSVSLWRKWNPWSSTTASTSQCSITTRLNKWKLNRDEYSILNTLIHERVHSFCLVHPDDDQTRPGNQCDASYIAGDLAEALILYRMGVEERVMDKPICPALLKKIDEYKLITVK